MISKFDSVDSIVHYLRESTLSSSVVDSTISKSHLNNNKLKLPKEPRKEKNLTNPMNTKPSCVITVQPQLEGDIKILPKGRVRYGPITVNPRKQPSKTLYTGRRSKYEVLSGDEEEKRRDRRERNRVAATKCREKRDNVLNYLENEYAKELNSYERLFKKVEDLKQQKSDLETFITNHFNECLLMNNLPSSSPQSSMIFGDTAFLSSINDTLPPPPLPSSQQPIFYNDDEEMSHILDPDPILTNSAYSTDDSNSILLPQQELQTITMTSGSIERLINNLQTPTISMENNNNHSILFNSAIGSSCAKQHSNSSEDDSLPSTRANPYVC
ncbi:unnamed protein product [Rotaria sp. Silwood2]|nr:unnamed protein product [Rotaria sp. Silwood2]CAF2966525.1 unnamed protein product [Rotaria sp. Silwood2]CAF3247080.1 unnamed protein product [Rotaria sp. Silwood2]CAF4108300.1 unnamed protein product [Rotaria sp. Silwood2]CAF4362874.1 unnamed protein product [Rotaria sp. Silwood2]